MGLFGSRRKVSVGTAVSRVVPDDALPNSIRTGVLKAIFGDENEPDMPAYIMEEIVSSVALRAERMYEWASTNYVHGLPSGAIYAAKEVEPAVKAELEASHGAEVTLSYAKLGPPNTLHIGWQQLVSQYGYNPETNTLSYFSGLEGFTCYLADMVVVVPTSHLPFIEEGALDQWGPSPRSGPIHSQINGRQFLKSTPVKADPNAEDEYLLVSYQFYSPMTTGDTPGGYITKSIVMPLESVYNDAKEYFHARYTVGGQTHFWMYEKGSGGRPGLDQLFTTAVANASFFPFGYFRYDKVSETENTDSESYKDGKKLLNYLNMDYGAIASGVDENPDIADVEQAMVMMAVPANTENELQRRYLFSFYEKWWTALGQGYSSPDQAGIAGRIQKDADLTKYAIVIKDARFTLNLTNGGLYKRRKAGVIAAIGGHNSSVVVENVTMTFIDAFSGLPYEKVIPIKTHVYQKQVSGTLYDEILVVNMKMLYFIEGEHKVTADEEDDILLVPIDRSITADYTLPDKETLYARSLHYVFNSLVVTKVKWYQTGIFRALMIVVAIVVTILSYGAAWQGMAAAISAGTITLGAVFMSIVIGVLKAVALSLAVKLFVKTIGIEAALIVAVLAALAGSYMAFQAGGVAGAPFARDLLTLSSGISKGVGHQVQVETGDLIAQASEFDKYVEEQTKTLEEAKELLESNSLISPFVIFGESPDDFYNRTVHSGNIGAIGIGAISQYVDAALTLPTLDQTIGDTQYG